MADDEDIYDIAPTSTETVKDFSKLIGRFDQPQRPAISVKPSKPKANLSPVQLPPKKSSSGTGPLSPGAIVSTDTVNSARRQLSVVPNKRVSCVRASQINSAAPLPKQGDSAPPAIPSKKAPAPTMIAETAKSSLPPQNESNSIDQRPPEPVPVESARPNSELRIYDAAVAPSDQYDKAKLSRLSKVSMRSSRLSMSAGYKKLPLPDLNGPAPPKPSKPPNVVLPSLEELNSEEVYDDICQPMTRVSELCEEEECTPPTLSRHQSKNKVDRRSHGVKSQAFAPEEVYEEVGNT